jgi:tetratricopeptide (TPR) repeat protein
MLLRVSNHMTLWRKQIAAWYACSIVVGLFVVGCESGDKQPVGEPATDGDRGSQQSQLSKGSAPPPVSLTPAMLETARQQFEAAYKRKADEDDILSWLAESAGRAGNSKVAITAFERIPSSHPRYGHASRYQQGLYLMKLNRVRDAERNFQEFLRLEGDMPQMQPAQVAGVLWQLVYIYGVELRLARRQEILAELHRLGHAQTEDTLGYCYPSLHRWNGTSAVTWLERFLERDPEDFHLRLAQGRYWTMRGRVEEARESLQQCRADQPDNLAAAAAMIECLVEQDDWPGVEKVMSQLPEVADSEPSLLLNLRGRFHNHQGRFNQAIDCYQRVIKTDPASAEAYVGLARAYVALEQADAQGEALRVASGLARIQNRIGWVLESEDNAEALKEIIEISIDIGLQQEARLMLETALKEHAGYKPFLELKSRLVPVEEEH